MKIKRSLNLDLGVALLFGTTIIWFSSPVFLEYSAYAVFGTLILSALILRIDMKETTPTSQPFKIMSYLVIGTMTPGARVDKNNNLPLRVFAVSAACLIGMALGIFVAGYKFLRIAVFICTVIGIFVAAIT